MFLFLKEKQGGNNMDIEAIKRFKIKSEPEDPTQEPIYTEAPIGAEQYFVSGSRGSGVHNLEEELWLEGGQYSGTDFMNDTQLVTTNVTYDKTTDEATMGSEVVSYLWVHNIGKNYIYEDTNYNVVKKFYLENDFYPSLNTYTGNVTYLDSTLTDTKYIRRNWEILPPDAKIEIDKFKKLKHEEKQKTRKSFDQVRLDTLEKYKPVERNIGKSGHIS